MRAAAGVCLCALLVGSVGPVDAQTPGIPSGPSARPAEGGAHINRGLFVDAAVSRYTLRTESIDADGAAPVLAVGYQVSRRFSLRVETIVRGRDFDHTRRARFSLRSGNELVEAALRQMSRDEIERVWPETDLRLARRVRYLVSALSGFHARAGSRVRVGLLAGLTFQGEESLERREDPTLVDLSPRYVFTTQTTAWRRTQVLIAGGIDVDVRVTSHLSVVPQLRLDVGQDANDPDDGILIVRPGVALRWAF